MRDFFWTHSLLEFIQIKPVRMIKLYGIYICKIKKMKSEERDLLKAEIDKYIQKKNRGRHGGRSEYVHLVSDVVAEFRDKKQGMRLLLENHYGLLGNLMFKYVRENDDEITRYIKEADTNLILETYRILGKRFIQHVDNWQTLKVLLKIEPGLIEQFDWYLIDKEYAYEVAEYCPRIMKNVVARIKADRDFTYRMISINPLCLEYAFWCYRADKEIAYEAVRKNPEAILFTDVSLRGDKDLIMEVVSHRGLLLSYADDKLKDDQEIVRAAVGNNWLAIRFASDRLQQDPEIEKLAEARRRQMGWHQ